jgi:hypothetical protein
MDNSTDKPKRTFQCPECGEHLTTKQNLRRHCLRKHKETVWESVVESPPITVNELIETDPLVSIILDDRGQPETDPQPEPIPGNEYLITLIRECEKYQHLFPAIKRQMKWNENNSNVDLDYHLRKHNYRMTYLLVDIRDAKLLVI